MINRKMKKNKNLPRVFYSILFMAIFFSCKKDEAKSQLPQFENRNVGQSAHEFLAAIPGYKGLIIEVRYMDGFEPNSTTIDNLKAFLVKRLNKPYDISIVNERININSQSSYTLRELMDVEISNRSNFKNENQQSCGEMPSL